MQRMNDMRHPSAAWASYRLSQAVAKLSGKGVRFSQLPQADLENEPAEIPCRPALYNPEHLSRVKKCAFGKSLSNLAGVLNASHYVEAPLERYHLGAATAIGGVLFTREARILHSKFVNASLRDTFAHTEVQEDVILASSMQGLRYFGHWLSDDVSAFEAYRHHPGLMSLPLPAWSDAVEYRKLFEQSWRQNMIIRSRSMTVLRDLGFSRRKAARYHELRARLRKNFGASDNSGQVVFLKRGPSGDPREIVNSKELEQRLSRAGVRIVTPEGDFGAFLRAILDASVIITIEGSQDRHAIYSLRDGGGMLTLLPPDRFYVATHEFVRCLDMHSGMVIGTSAEGGFTINPDEVLEMTDRLLSRIEAGNA